MRGFRWVCPLLAIVLIGATTGQGAGQPVREAAMRVPQAPPPPDQQFPEMRIAAVVNNEVVSVYDLVSRMRMIMISSNIPDTPENRKKLAPQVLRSLIDERLELEEAKQQGVTATDAEIKHAIAQIEKQNNMPPGSLNDFLKARGIDRTTLVNQITASIEWAKLVRRKAAETVDITDDDIDRAMKRLKEHADAPEERVAEIFLSVDNPAQDEQVRQLAEKLTQQMRQGARFSAVARQFSQSATAAVGGDLGWLRTDELPPELRQAAAQLKPGELSAPIRGAGGYYLLLVLDRRTGNGEGEEDRTFDIVQVVFPLSPQANDAARQQAIEEAAHVRAAATDCPTLLKIGKQKAPQLSSEGKLRADEISPKMLALVEQLKIGEASEPILQRNGVGVIMVCSKQNGAPAAITRQTVADSLLAQRLDMVARQYLEDLRRQAYIDVRV
ncbi:MAG TPA: peptidylprolyl isomerase [Stellaceae bacterium]|nr:peptidylprolyl isomerase [Stellaceae bacterium]